MADGIHHFQHASTERRKLAFVSFSHSLFFVLLTFCRAKFCLKVLSFINRLKNGCIAIPFTHQILSDFRRS